MVENKTQGPVPFKTDRNGNPTLWHVCKDCPLAHSWRDGFKVNRDKPTCNDENITKCSIWVSGRFLSSI